MWAIIALIVIVIVGIVWYIQQQKKEEEVAAAAAATAAVETSPSVPSGSVVDTMQSIPATQTGITHQTIPYLVAAGRAKSEDDCRTAAERAGYKSWVYNKENKSCYAYIDNTVLMRMGNTTYIDTNYKKKRVVGCTQPGMKVIEGCEDWTIGDKVRGQGGATTTAELEPIETGISLDACIAKGRSQNVDAIRYAGNGSGASTQGKCYEIVDTANLVGYTGNPSEMNYVQACTDPSKKIINGCE